MGLDLRALLQQQGQKASPALQTGPATEPADKLANKPIRLVLELGSAETLAARRIQGVIGVRDEIPFFINTPKTVGEIADVLARAYAAYADAYVPPQPKAKLAESAETGVN